MESSKICCLFNFAPHYRKSIYKAIADNFGAHFYFGDSLTTNIQKLDYNELPGFQTELKRVNLFWGVYWLKGIFKLVKNKYDVYIVTGEPFCLSIWLLAFYCKIKRKRVVAWTHGWYGKESGIKKFIKKSFFKLFSHILTYNEYSLSLMQKEGFKPCKMSCVANSLDSYVQREIRGTLRKSQIYSSYFNNNFPVVLYCGRIQKVKKLDMIINSIAELNRNNIGCNLVFVGKDVDNVNIKNIAIDAGIEKYVWEYGPCYDEAKLGELFYNAAVCVSPGNVGLTSIHSLTYGCPVITHDNFAMQMPEFEAVKEGITGSFFKENNLIDLTSKIKIWIKKTEEDREKARIAAYDEIDRKWNIDYQIGIIKKAIDK